MIEWLLVPLAGVSTYLVGYIVVDEFLTRVRRNEHIRREKRKELDRGI